LSAWAWWGLIILAAIVGAVAATIAILIQFVKGFNW
jgi:hypothetical protein